MVKAALYSAVEAALLECNPAAKVAQAQQLWRQWQRGEWLTKGAAEEGSDSVEPPQPLQHPGRPLQPELVAPRDLSRRKPTTPEGRAVLIHSIVHIEFNAINLALDAAYRFRGLPDRFYGDWLRVAAEEGYHFALLESHLQWLGYRYGDFVAHNGLWEMALKTAADPLARMALVPRTLEARGLDVTPAIQAKLRAHGDPHAAQLLEIIFADEIGHVALGDYWFRTLCQQRTITDPAAHYRVLLAAHGVSLPRPPFQQPARQQAGFSAVELASWED